MALNQNLTEGWIKLNFALLALIGGGVGWLIVQNDIRLDKHDAEIEIMKESLNDLRNISSNLIEAYNGKVEKDKLQDLELQKQRDEILELWKCNKRSGTAKELTLK